MASNLNKDHLNDPSLEGAERYLLPPDQVHFSISPDYVAGIEATTGDFHIIGQPRAISALKMAISINAKGYNVFASGLPGTGKRTAITSILKEYQPDISCIQDIAFAANFGDDLAPRLIRFPKGEARLFQKKLKETLSRLRNRSRELFKKRQFRDQRDKIIIDTEGKDNTLLKDFENRLGEQGFQLVRLMDQEESHPDIFPVFRGEAMDFEKLQDFVQTGELSQEDFQLLREQYFRFTDELNQLFMEIHDNRLQMEDSIGTLRTQALAPLVEAELRPLFDEWVSKEITGFLGSLKKHLPEALSQPESEENTAEILLARCSLNVLIDHSETEGAPIVFETNPDMTKLFGLVESPQENSEPRPPHQLMRAGSLLQASGGFLVLRAEDVLQQEDVWHGLKRALESGRTEIRNHPGPYGVAGPAIKSGDIPLHVKVIMTGTDGLYEMLYNIDEEFQKLFKVPAEFDSVMPRCDQAIREYIGFASMICQEENLRPTTPDGLAAIIEYGVRLAEHRDHLSTQFSLIADLLREADYWARQAESSRISAAMVHRALDERRFLANLPEEKIDEQIQSGELLIDVQGTAVGRINGLAILD
ncbi:MAG: ATP-dependent protease, partial [Spirochaetaceae bacterium]